MILHNFVLIFPWQPLLLHISLFVYISAFLTYEIRHTRGRSSLLTDMTEWLHDETKVFYTYIYMCVCVIRSDKSENRWPIHFDTHARRTCLYMYSSPISFNNSLHARKTISSSFRRISRQAFSISPLLPSLSSFISPR